MGYSLDADAASAGLSKKNIDGSIAALKGGDIRVIDVNGVRIIDDNDRLVIGNPNRRSLWRIQ